MKIGILADPLDNQTAGVHNYTKHLILALHRYDRENEYILIREKRDPTMPLRQIAVPNIRLPIGFASFRHFFLIPIIARMIKLDAVLEPAHFGPFNLPKKIKRITVIHDLTPLLFPKFHRFHSQLLQRIFLKGILRKADLILTNSEHTSRDVGGKFPFTSAKMATILLGKDQDFRPVLSREYLDKKGWNSPFFMYAGTIEPRKNLNLLLTAFRHFREQVEERVLLIIVGKEGWKTKSFFENLERHPYRDDIILTGFVEKDALIELYSHTLALVYPSLYEGFGLPVLEALSCGARVICSNCSSLPEVGGEHALYFDPNNQPELLAHLITAYKNFPVSTEEKNKWIGHTEKYSWGKYVQEFKKAVASL